MMEEGYDVWLGNNRGSMFSLGHETMDYTEHEFWDFSWAEMGLYDVPANIGYIHEASGNQKVTYFGYSQGTT